MTMHKIILLGFLIASLVYADTPPPTSVKAKTYSGDGLTAITATGTSLNVNVTNGSSGGTVNQGSPGPSPWPVSIAASTPIPVTGGFLTDAQLRATPVPVTGSFSFSPSGTQNVAIVSSTPLPVTGTFFQATQPVSGSVSVSNFPSTQNVSIVASTPVPVTGTFFQATQPVSIAGTVNAAIVASTPIPVTGTFFQATQPVSGTVAATQSGTWNITNVSGTISLPTGAATEASLVKLPLAQGSTTSGQSGVLNQGAVTTGTPTYTTAQTSPLSLTTSGLLRVDGSNVTQPVSGTVTALPSGTQNVSIVSSTPIPVTGTFFQGTQPVSIAATVNAAIVSSTPLPVTGTFFQATQPVSGTVTANIGTSGSLALDASVTGLHYTQGSTTSGQSGPIIQGAVTTATPTYVTATTRPLSLTTTGLLRTDGSSVTQPVSGTVTITPSGTQNVSIVSSTPVPVTQSGTWTVQPGNTANSTAWLVTGTGGTFPATQSGTWNITNISGTVSLPTGASTEASLVKIPLAQGSTTSGQSGPLMQGAVTTAAPSYTTAQTSPLSLTTAGALRVDSSAVTQPVSIAATVNTAIVSSTPIPITNSSLTTIATNTGKQPINTTGTQVTGTVSTVITLTAPASTVGFILQAADANTANVRYRVGSTATTTSGNQLQAGRDTGFVPLGANISIVAESGTQEYQVLWVSQ